jgi:hypothetical protein
MIPLLDPVRKWYCPNCGMRDQTREVQPHTRFHTCPRMGFLSAPMLMEGVKAKVETHEREDYIGNDKVRLDANGRPVMSITTTRDDGEDVVVFAPTATVTGGAF